MGDKPRPMPLSSWQALKDKDEQISSNLAICASVSSTRGHLRPLMKVLEYSCHGVPWLFGVSSAILMTHKTDLHEKQINLLSALLIDLIVVAILKALVRRRRPQHNEMDMITVSVDKYSFPSGHCTRAGMLMLFLTKHFPVGFVISGAIYSWAVAVSLSRLLLGRHHVSDVTFGFFWGLLQYGFIQAYMWIPSSTCEGIVSFIEEDFHL